MKVSTKETFAICALTILAGTFVDTKCIHDIPRMSFNSSEIEGRFQYLTADGYWATAKNRKAAAEGHRRKLKVRKPGCKSKAAKAAAHLLLDISSASSTEMPAPDKTFVKAATKKVKRKAEDGASDPGTSRKPSPTCEPAAMPADAFGSTGASLGHPAGPSLVPAAPNPAPRASKRARQRPAAMADYIIG